MILSGHDRYWKQPDPYHRNYACVEYSAMGAAWLKAEGIYPVHIVSMQNHDQSWGHTLCEVPSLGTYDFQGNIFFPDYYWHKRPINDTDLSKITKAVEWTDYQKLSIIEDYYKYDKTNIGYINIWTHTLVQSKEGIDFKNKTCSKSYDGPVYSKDSRKKIE